MDVSDFGNSASQFSLKEELALRINISDVDCIKDIIGTTDDVIDDTSFAKFYLPGFNKGEIMTFVPTKHPELFSSQKKFLNKLRIVMVNNDITSVGINFEKYIDEFVSFLYSEMEFDDGEELTMQPCHLRMEIGETTFAAYADREGRRGTEIVWILNEDKHRGSTRYKKGEVQMVACMIAAMQWNYSISEDACPKKIIGIRVIGDKFCFYSANVSTSYLEDLRKGLPKRNLTVKKYPSGDGLEISSESDRKKILECLYLLKKYAITIVPVY